MTHLIVDDVGPRDVLRHLQDSRVALFAVQNQRVPVALKVLEAVVQPETTPEERFKVRPNKPKSTTYEVMTNKKKF